MASVWRRGGNILPQQNYSNELNPLLCITKTSKVSSSYISLGKSQFQLLLVNEVVFVLDDLKYFPPSFTKFRLIECKTGNCAIVWLQLEDSDHDNDDDDVYDDDDDDDESGGRDDKEQVG